MKWQLWASTALTLSGLLGVGCTTHNDSSDSGLVPVKIQGQYEKRSYANGTLGSVSTYPTRFAYVEIYDQNKQLLADGYLGEQGQGEVNLPRGVVFSFRVSANVQVTDNKQQLILNGHVIGKEPAANYTWKSYQDEANQYVFAVENPNTYKAGADTAAPLIVKVPESTDYAGPFSLADRMVDYALFMDRLKVMLPDMAVYWSDKIGDSYPRPLMNGDQGLWSESAKCPVLKSQFKKEPEWRKRLFNDSYVLENFSRSVFSKGSLWSGDSASTLKISQLCRADNLNESINLGYASEPAAAFMAGYSHFLAAAIANQPVIWNAKVGNQPVHLDLSSASPSLPVGGGELYGASVARSLWTIWKTGFGGSQDGLGLIWDATAGNLANQTNEYGNTLRACFPSYLVGLNRLATAQYGAGVSAKIEAALVAENVGDGRNVINGMGTYFTQRPFVWEGTQSLPTTWIGQAVTTYPSLDPNWVEVFSDEDQDRGYQVYLGPGSRKITLSNATRPLLVQVYDQMGLLVELEGSNETWVLPIDVAGNYLIRVRVNPFLSPSPYVQGAVSYSLKVE